jgi:3-methyladenine DNA glycosylase AlkC
MAFYDLDKAQRALLVETISSDLYLGISTGHDNKALVYLSDQDTYIRKTAYIAMGRLYFQDAQLALQIIATLHRWIQSNDFYIRQTVVNAAGEIGKKDFAIVRHIFETSLFDHHHAVRNAVIGSVKKMAEVNPVPVLDWAKTYLEHPDPEIRREICHGIELRGRKHPQDILPLLQHLEWDKKARVRTTLVHVLGQIAYKKGCLAIVIAHLKQWENQALVQDALKEIVSVHHRYRNFATLSQDEAIAYIRAQGLSLND